MMRTMIGLLFPVLLGAPVVLGQGQLPERLLPTSGINVGTGSRALGLGGTYTGIADDFSSVWWNPAGLAQVKRIEFQGSVSRTGLANDTKYYGVNRDGTTSSLRLNNIGFVLPVPVYQGALSFALGYNQVTAYDRRARITGPSSSSPDYANWQSDALRWNSFDELENGRLGLWSLAGAMDVSPNLALGVGLNYWTGVNEYTLTGFYPMPSDTDQFVDNVYREMSVTTDVAAWGANVGALWRMGRYARMGLMLHTPMNWRLEDDFSWSDRGQRIRDRDDGYFDYRMTYPAVIRVGASVAPGRWLVAADIEYRDWASMQFRSEPPVDNLTKPAANQRIKDLYHSTTRYSVGGEYLFPAYGLRARAGYSFEPSVYEEANASTDRHGFAFGVGVLVDRSVMLDVAFHTTSFTEKLTRGLTEDVSATNTVFTLSYRM